MSTRERCDLLLGCTQIRGRVETNSCKKRQHMRAGRIWGKLSLKFLELLWVKAKDLPFIVILKSHAGAEGMTKMQRSGDGLRSREASQLQDQKG